MAKYIRLTDELLKQCRDDFESALLGLKMSEGKFNFIKTFACEKKKATIWYTTKAWLKLQFILSNCDKEVGWHSIAKRSESNDNEFIVYDCEIYPQTVTGTNVNTDQTKYQMWLYEHDDETFKNIRMQCHSHVRMGVTPSGVDTNLYERILEQMTEQDFYIFQIWNKDGKFWSKIYDMPANIMYETDDIEVKMLSDCVDYHALADDIKNLVVEKSYATSSYPSYSSSPYSSAANKSTTPAAKTETQKPEEKTEKKSDDKSKEKSGKGKGDKKKGTFGSESELERYYRERYQQAFGGWDD